MTLPFQSRLLVVISLILIELAYALPISVCSNGSDCSPVQDCIDAPVPGDLLGVQGCNGSDMANSAAGGGLTGNRLANGISPGCSSAAASAYKSAILRSLVDVADGCNPDRVVMLSAIPVEYEAILAHLVDLREESTPEGDIYQVGEFSANNRTWQVAVGLAGMHNPNAAVATERAIRELKPEIVFFVGTAGGVCSPASFSQGI
jgi:hypothetical protein